MFKELMDVYKRSAKRTAEEMSDMCKSKVVAGVAAAVFPPYALYKWAENTMKIAAEDLANAAAKVDHIEVDRIEVVYTES